MLYTANWGTRELAFRFSRSLVDLERLQQYYWATDEITLKSTEQHVVLDIIDHRVDQAAFAWCNTKNRPS